MNPRQRRGVLLVIIAGLGLLAVFVSMLVFVSNVNANVGNQVAAVALAQDVRAYQTVTPEMLTTVQVPEKWLSPTAVRDPAQVVGLVPLSNIAKGAYADTAMFTASPTLKPGFREIAIMVDPETGVGGDIKTGDRVEIIATYQSQSEGGEQANGPCIGKAVYVVQNALITNVGVVQDVDTNASSSFSQGRAVPVTFALSLNDALKVASAESFSVKLRLALRPINDDTTVPGSQASYCEERP